MLQNYNKWRVLQAFFLEPRRQFQIRQLSRRLKLAVPSVRNYLSELRKGGLVVQSANGVYKSYIANFDNDKFRFYKKMDTIIRINECRLLDELKKLMPGCIILFGSCAKGEDIEGSDLDIFIQAPAKEINLKKYEHLLKRGIQLFFKEDFNKLPTELKNNILNGVMLYGYLKVF
jgi:predicted nucleotidyltransferase